MMRRAFLETLESVPACAVVYCLICDSTQSVWCLFSGDLLSPDGSALC